MEKTAEALRFQMALAMAETGVRLMRQNLRRRYPHASDAEVDTRLREWMTNRPMDADPAAQANSLR